MTCVSYRPKRLWSLWRSMPNQFDRRWWRICPVTNSSMSLCVCKTASQRDRAEEQEDTDRECAFMSSSTLTKTDKGVWSLTFYDVITQSSAPPLIADGRFDHLWIEKWQKRENNGAEVDPPPPPFVIPWDHTAPYVQIISYKIANEMRSHKLFIE